MKRKIEKVMEKLSSPRFTVSIGKRIGLPLKYLLPIAKCIRIMFSPLKYLSRKIKAAVISNDTYLKISSEGYVRFNIFEDFRDEHNNLIEICQNIVKTKRGELEEHKKNKPYLINVTEPCDFNNHPEIIQFALNEKLTKSIAKYLGTVPVLSDIRIWVCPPNSTDDSGSQQFHIDQEDNKQIKLFICLTDVTSETGATSFIPASTSRQVYKTVEKPYDRISDELMYSLIDKKELATFTGNPGDAMGVDVSRCYHYGSRMIKQERNVLVLQYVSCNEILETPPFVNKSAFNNLELTEWQRMVVPQHRYNYIN